MRTTTTFALILATSLAACGGDDGGTVTQIDARRIDATGGDIDAAAAGCQISSPNFMNLTTTMATFRRRPQSSMMPNPNVYYLGWGALLEMGTPSDALIIELWPGFGGIPAGELAPGTYQLNGDNGSLANCGACVYMMSNYDTGSGMGDQDYMPTAGTLTINTVNPTVPGTIDLTLTGVMMQHVDIDAMGVTTPAADAATCTTQFSAQISGTVAAPAKMAAEAVKSPIAARHN
ncbi:MAG: hypothetical protein IPH44_37885 [Myxococcales bacterium]|nr:hypothetical protein [Myxococcales bacterium]MBK7197070.1 hypothetical protein [Myxococcales bacterium]